MCLSLLHARTFAALQACTPHALCRVSIERSAHIFLQLRELHACGLDTEFASMCKATQRFSSCSAALTAALQTLGILNVALQS